MADETDNSVVGAARTIGSTVGKVVSALGGGATPASQRSPANAGAKENVWQAEYAGSGTFIVHKPKRKAGKRHQQIVRNRRRGMRK